MNDNDDDDDDDDDDGDDDEEQQHDIGSDGDDDDDNDEDDEGDDNVSFSQNYWFRSGDIPAWAVMAFFSANSNYH